MPFVKTCLLILIALAMIGEKLSAQTFTVLHAFTATSLGPPPNYPDTNSDGSSPISLLLSGNTIYGTASGGGDNGSGEVFSTDPNRDGLSELHVFNAFEYEEWPTATNADGASPSSLIQSGNTLYGTTGGGGTNGSGTIFSMNIDGGNFTVLHTFAPLTATNSFGVTTNYEGAPYSGNIRTLALYGNTLYGTASLGGTNGYGTIFSLCTNGTAFTVLHTFASLDPFYQTNFDGANPQPSLLLLSNTLYGVASYGGTNGSGTIFSLNTNGTGFTVLYAFSTWIDDVWSGALTNSDGTTPICPLVASGNTLYGAAFSGGTNGNGTVFQINADGTGFTVLHTFTAGINDYNTFETNLDGADIHYLLLHNNLLLGSTLTGGINGNGTIFSLNTNGNDFVVRHTFYGDADGKDPCDIVLSGNTLYGVASDAGPNGNGTIFSLGMVPIITSLSVAGTNVVITAANDIIGGTYTLLTSTDLTLPLNQWTPVATNAAGTSTSFTITNAANPNAQFQCYTLQKQ